MSLMDIVIVGNGGFAKEVEWLLERINNSQKKWNLLGFIDKNTDGERVIGDDSFLTNMKNELYVVIAIGDSEKRRELYEKYKVNANLKFPNLFDPSVIMSQSIHMGIGNIICAGCIMTVEIKMGNFNIFNLDCTIGHASYIGNYVTLNPSVNISGNVYLGNESNVGTGTHIIQGIKIEDNVIIGAGTVVIKNIPRKCTLVGNPGRIIKYR